MTSPVHAEIIRRFDIEAADDVRYDDPHIEPCAHLRRISRSSPSGASDGDK